MGETFIVTKFLIPIRKPQYIDRPQLLRKLRLGLQYKLILISAPPGFGKTTLLAEWLSKRKIPYTWLSLDEQDDAPVLFLRYFIGAVQRALPEFGMNVMSSMDALPQPPISSLFAAISNELSNCTQPLLIVLDDFQSIKDPAIHHGLVFLLDHFPATVHLCIATRLDPPWKIARMRTQQNILEIRIDDLRFDPVETARFLEKTMALKLERDDLQTLVDHTEGWVAALQMAANSLIETLDAHAFINSFAGSHRLVVDYLSEEVLSRQTSATRDFLIKTSLLDQLNGSLCNAFLERSDGFEMLGQLEKANLFLRPIDEKHSWFQYHKLFQELLQNQLELHSPETIRKLHRNASMWFLAHDDPLDSLKHAIKAGDPGIAANIAEQYSLRFLDRGQISEVSSWIASLPSDLISNWPWLLISRAWVDLYMARFDRLEISLKLAEGKLAVIKNPAARERIMGHTHAIRAHSGLLNSHPEESLKHASQALALLPEGDGMGRCHAHIAMGNYYRRVEALDHSIIAYEKAVAYAQESRIEHLRVLALGYLANIHSLRGREIDKAEKLCRQLMEEYPNPARRRSLPALAFPMASLSQLLMNRGEFLNALVLCEEAVELSRYWQHADTLRFALTVLSNIHICLDDPQRAQHAFLEARLIAETPSAWYAPSLTFLELQYYLQTGDLEPIRLWSENLVFDYNDIQLHADWYILYARYLLTIGDFQQAIVLTEHLIGHFKALDIPYQVATLLGDQACAFYGSGDMEKALANVAQLVEFGKIEQATVPIYRKGTLMLDLLKIALARGIKPERVRKLLDAIHDLFPQAGHSGIGGGNYLAEHLTSREVEVLGLLDSGLSSTRIAKALSIAVSTVRTHIKSIYNKLGVNHRIEAIHKGKELKII